jgi:transposase
MESVERVVARETKAMTRRQVILKAIEGQITWIQAAQIAGISDRQMRRLKRAYECQGIEALRDYRGRKQRRLRISMKTIGRICKLKRERYADFSVKHFHEQLTEKHKIRISYTWTKIALQEAGLIEKAPARGKYRRRRERRPMSGMLLHMDASTHRWIRGLPPHDLNVVLDDADGRILHAEFVEQEGLASTFSALRHVLEKHGRFCELYTDHAAHFCRTLVKGRGPAEEQNGNVCRALRALGIRQILARSPEARGRSERCFGTIQRRLPQELRVAGIKDYNAANRYLRERFIPDFNSRFTVVPAQPETAFIPLIGVELDVLLSIHHDRVVRSDSTVTCNGVILQLPQLPGRPSYARCPVTVHELVDGSYAMTFQGRVLARFNNSGALIRGAAAHGTAA